jgi:hypothetical protein
VIHTRQPGQESAAAAGGRVQGCRCTHCDAVAASEWVPATGECAPAAVLCTHCCRRRQGLEPAVVSHRGRCACIHRVRPPVLIRQGLLRRRFPAVQQPGRLLEAVHAAQQRTCAKRLVREASQRLHHRAQCGRNGCLCFTTGSRLHSLHSDHHWHRSLVIWGGGGLCASFVFQPPSSCAVSVRCWRGAREQFIRCQSTQHVVRASHAQRCTA